MKCPYCSANVTNVFAICPKCRQMLRRSRAVAALLNFLLPGAGYLYCGALWGLAVLAFSIIDMLFASLLTEEVAVVVEPPADLSSWLSDWLIANLDGIFFAAHAAIIADNDNRSLASNMKKE